MIVAKLRRLLPYAPAAIVVAFALFIAWAFAATTLRHAGEMGLPLDDSYIYLTYGKQFGRAEPFTYYPGGGYSAGSTSVLWPMLLAPFWTLGARGHALVWVSFGLCAVLYAAVGVGIYRFVRIVRGDHAAGIVAAITALSIAPFAFCALSGMEVAFAAALLVASMLMLATAPREGRPSWLLIACLAATSLSRPEAMIVVGGIVGASVLQRMYRRAWREVAWWCMPLVPPLMWLVANRLIAGHLFPNTGVAKSHFYLPGFDWTYWWTAVPELLSKLSHGLLADRKTPLLFPASVFLLYFIGSCRIVGWGVREKRLIVAFAIVLAPVVTMFAVIASSGLWNFQNYRYIAAALPLIFIPVGVALSPVAEIVRGSVVARRIWQLAVVVLALGFVRTARPGLVADMRLFAQGAMDTGSQVVAIGRYVDRKLPDATVMFHDAGAIAYYGDGPVFDMLGLVTNHQAGVANNGPGARFEFLESLPADRRPSHFAYYPGWMGQTEFFGDVLMHTSLRGRIDPRYLVGEMDMQVIRSRWDHARTAERPVNDHTGWAIVDRVDVADLASERAHHWNGHLGRRNFGDPTAKWSVVEKQSAGRLQIDGGRTIRGRTERFTVRLDPMRPTRVVIRTGGQKSYPWHDAIDKPIELTLHVGAKQLGKLTLAPPAAVFEELTFNLPPGSFNAPTVELRTRGSGVYRVFHWFVLQPE